MKTVRSTGCLALIICLCISLTYSQEKQEKFPVLTGPYLGQKPPGLTAEIFAPELIGSPLGIAVSPDAHEIYYAMWGGEPQARIMYVKYENGRWTAPQTASFSGEFMDWDVNFSPDGSRLYFSSRRPLPGSDTPKEDADTWFVERTAAGWGTPQNPGLPVNTEKEEVHPTVAANGNLYFFCNIDDGSGNNIYLSRYINGSYAKPEKLGMAINTGHHEMDPFIAPDESYLIFHSERPNGIGTYDLYISFRKENKAWSPAINMGEHVNAERNNLCGRVSHDGKYLFFRSTRNGVRGAYWIDAAIIETLKKDL
ncbi:TolB family protein [candidate division KSB1 bacterium]